MCKYQDLVEEIGLTGAMNPYNINIEDYSIEYLH